MKRLRYNKVRALVGSGGIDASATSLPLDSALSSLGVDLPSFTAADGILPLVVEDEVMYVTAYTTGTTTATVLRGMEGTTAAAHALGEQVVHAPTVWDYILDVDSPPVWARGSGDYPWSTSQGTGAGSGLPSWADTSEVFTLANPGNTPGDLSTFYVEPKVQYPRVKHMNLFPDETYEVRVLYKSDAAASGVTLELDNAPVAATTTTLADKADWGWSAWIELDDTIPAYPGFGFIHTRVSGTATATTHIAAWEVRKVGEPDIVPGAQVRDRNGTVWAWNHTVGVWEGERPVYRAIAGDSGWSVTGEQLPVDPATGFFAPAFTTGASTPSFAATAVMFLGGIEFRVYGQGVYHYVMGVGSGGNVAADDMWDGLVDAPGAETDVHFQAVTAVPVTLTMSGSFAGTSVTPGAVALWSDFVSTASTLDLRGYSLITQSSSREPWVESASPPASIAMGNETSSSLDVTLTWNTGRVTDRVNLQVYPWDPTLGYLDDASPAYDAIVTSATTTVPLSTLDSATHYVAIAYPMPRTGGDFDDIAYDSLGMGWIASASVAATATL